MGEITVKRYLNGPSRKYKQLTCECPMCGALMRVRLIEINGEYMICTECSYLYNNYDDPHGICVPVAE